MTLKLVHTLISAPSLNSMLALRPIKLKAVFSLKFHTMSNNPMFTFLTPIASKEGSCFLKIVPLNIWNQSCCQAQLKLQLQLQLELRLALHLTSQTTTTPTHPPNRKSKKPEPISTSTPTPTSISTSTKLELGTTSASAFLYFRWSYGSHLSNELSQPSGMFVAREIKKAWI